MACLAVADSVLAALVPTAHIDVAAARMKIAAPAAIRQGLRGEFLTLTRQKRRLLSQPPLSDSDSPDGA
jgi:hypothetical protein